MNSSNLLLIGSFRHQSARLLDARRVLSATILLSCLLYGDSTPALEETGYAGPILDDKYFLVVGGFFSNVNSEVRIDSSSGGPGSGVDLEDDFGLDSQVASPYLYFRWRYHPVHRLEFEYYELLRNGARISQRSFSIGDISGDAGVAIQTGFDVRIGRLTYGYDLLKDEKKEFGILAGAHVTSAKVDFRFTGDFTIEGVGDVTGAVAEEEASLTFPLPHVGAFFAYSFTPNLSTQLDLLLFRIEMFGVRGTLTEANATLHYQFAKHVGIGTGFKFYRFNLEDKGFSERDSRFDYDFFGPVLYGSVSF